MTQSNVSAENKIPSQAELISLLECYQAGRFSDAEKLAQSFTEKFPQHPFAWKMLGAILGQTGRLSDSLAYMQKSVQLSPQDAEAYNNLGNVLKALGRLNEAEASYKQAITLKPDYAEAHSNLGNTLKGLGKSDEAEASYRQAITLRSDFAEAHSNLGNVLKALGRLNEAEASYRQAITLRPDYAEAYSNLGATLKELGRLDEAEASCKQAVFLKPDYAEARYNLGLCLFYSEQYGVALKEFELTDIGLSKSYAIRCSYLQDEESIFYERLDSLINQGQANAVIGSVICCSEIRYGVKRENPFCNEPLQYVLKTDLHEQYDFDEIFIKSIKDVLTDNSISFKPQPFLTNGVQTAGNIFAVKKISGTEIESIIIAEVEKYRDHFKDSDEGFIRNWPTSYKIEGWLVSMRSGGKLAAHMHESGWISGSVYVNVPVKSETNSGNLVLCLDEQVQTQELKGPNSQEHIIDVETGSLCLFPSSLHHYTVPFEDKENRIVLAFDIMPN